MKWDEISKEARETMKFIGNFSPTVNVDNREIKGYMIGLDDGEGGKVYLYSHELKSMAKHFIEVSEWLDKRANVKVRG